MPPSTTIGRLNLIALYLGLGIVLLAAAGLGSHSLLGWLRHRQRVLEEQERAQELQSQLLDREQQQDEASLNPDDEARSHFVKWYCSSHWSACHKYAGTQLECRGARDFKSCVEGRTGYPYEYLSATCTDEGLVAYKPSDAPSDAECFASMFHELFN